MAVKEFVCSRCYQAFMLPDKTSWLTGERMPCPFCKSRDTSPMLSLKVDGRRLEAYTFRTREELERTRESLVAPGGG
jgi:DNA-directed RNA polymerase subunit RPC12/RpoP